MRPDGDNGAPQHALFASVARRLLALVYEVLLLVALLLAGSVLFVMLLHGTDPVWIRPLFQLYLVALAATYFVWHWRRGGQTLAMKTWRMRLVARDGSGLSWSQAATRFLFALAGTLLFGAGFLWALVDRDGLFLHDRLAGTKIVQC